MNDTLRAKLQIDTDLSQVGKMGSALDSIFDQKRTVKLDAKGSEATIKSLADAAQKALKDTDVTIDVRAGSVDKVRSDLEELYQTQSKALVALKAGGKGGTDEYRDLLAATKKTRDAIAELGEAGAQVAKDLDLEEPKSALEQIKDLAKSAFAFEAAGKAADFLGGLAEKGAALADAQRSLKAQTGASAEEMERLNRAARDAFIGGVGESVAEATKAIATAKSMLGDTFNEAELGGFVTQAGAIAKVFDTDINEVIGKSRTFVKQFGLSGKEAGDLLSLAFQQGNTAAQDVGDTLSEYSQHLKIAGFTAEESIGFLTKGAQAGTRDLDKLADTAKEATIRLKAGDTSNALLAIKSPITETIAGIVKAGEQGSLSVKEVMQKTAAATEQAFKEGKISESIRSQLQVAIGGTPAEDLGSDIYAKVFGAPIDTEVIRAQAVLAGQQLGDAIEPKTATAKIGRAFEAFGETASATFHPIISGASDSLKAISQMGPGVKIVGDGMKALKASETFGPMIGSALDFGKAILTKVVPGIFAQTAATGAQTVATGTATTATAALNATMLLNPAFLIVAGITALVGAFILFGDSTESVEEALEGVNGAMETTKSTLDATAVIDKQQQGLRGLANEYDNLKGKTDPESQKRFAEVARELADAFPMATEGAAKLGEQQTVNTDITRSYIDSQLRANEAMRAGAAAELAKETADLVESTREAKEESADLTKERERAQERLLKLEKSAEGGSKAAAAMAERERKFLQEKDIALGKVNKQIQEGEKATREAVAMQEKSGMSWQQIAKDNGISVAEAKRYSAEQRLIEKEAYESEKAASALTATTFDAVKAAEALAGQWNGAKSQIDAALNTSKAAVLQIRRQLKTLDESGRSGLFANLERGMLQAQESAQFDVTVGLNADQKEMKGMEEQLEKELNPEVTPTANTTKLEKQVLDFTDTWIKNERGAFDIREQLRIKGIADDEKRTEAENENRLRLIRRGSQDELDAIDKRIAEASKKESKALEKARQNLEDAQKRGDTAKVAQFQDEIKKRQQAIEQSTNVEIVALKESRAAILENQKAQEEEASADLLEKQISLLRGRLSALAAEELAQYDAQTALLTLKREQRGEEDGVAIEDSLQMQLQLIDRQFDQQALRLVESLDTYKEYEAQVTEQAQKDGTGRAEVLRMLEAKKQELILEEQRKGSVRFVLLAEQRTDAESKAIEESSKKWEEWYAKWKGLQDEADLFLKAKVGVREAIYSAHTDALTDEARRGVEERLALLDKESEALSAEYSQGEKSYQEYIDKLVDIARQRAEAEEDLAAGSISFLDDVNARLAAGFDKLRENVQSSLDETLNEVADLKAPVSEALDDVLAVTGAALGSALVSGKNVAQEGANVALDIAGQVLTSLVPTFLAQIFGSSFAAGPFGIAIAAAASATLLALVGKAKGSLAKKFEHGGEVSGPRQFIEINERGVEYVVNHPTYKRVGRTFFDRLQAGDTPLAAAMRTMDRQTISEQIRFLDPSISPHVMQQIHVAAGGGQAQIRVEQLEAELRQTNEKLADVTNELRMIRTQESFRKVQVEVTTDTEVIRAWEAKKRAVQAARS